MIASQVKAQQKQGTKKTDWPRLCMICSAYVKGSDLRDHMKSHAGKINHQCPYCFDNIQSNDMPQHMKSHTGEKPYFCTICRFRCKSKTMLKFHKRKEHNWEEKSTEVVSAEVKNDSDKDVCEDYPSMEVTTPKHDSDLLANPGVASKNETFSDITFRNENSQDSPGSSFPPKDESFSPNGDDNSQSPESSFQQYPEQNYFCQLCLTTISSQDIPHHKCLSMFNRADYHFLLRDRHFELSCSEMPSSDVGCILKDMQQLPSLDNLVPHQYLSLQLPESSIICGVCSCNLDFSDVKNHMMTYHQDRLEDRSEESLKRKMLKSSFD